MADIQTFVDFDLVLKQIRFFKKRCPTNKYFDSFELT